MSFYRQNADNQQPRNGTAPCRDAYPASMAVYAPQALPMAMENPGTTLPSDGFSAEPSTIHLVVSYGRHDGLQGRLMEVGQADMYTSMPGQPFPRAGTWEEPGGPIAASLMPRLAPTTSAHMGLAQATGAGPPMLFVAPPVFTVQAKPIYALGL